MFPEQRRNLFFTRATTVLQQFHFLPRNAPCSTPTRVPAPSQQESNTMYIPWNQKKHIPSAGFFLFLFPEQSPACLGASGTWWAARLNRGWVSLSCSHWNKGPAKMNRVLLKGLGCTWSFLSLSFALQTCILKLLNPVPNRNRFELQANRTPKTLLPGHLFHPKPCSVKWSLNFVQAIPLYPEPAYMCSFSICERGCKTSFGGKGDSSHLK